MFKTIKLYIAALTAGIILTGILWGQNGNPAIEAANYTVPFKVVKDQNGFVALSEKDFVKGKPRFYIYRLPETSVRFFVLRSSDGVVRAALDACEVCYAAKKGFHQEGDLTVCNNCGNRYPSVRINVETGGCNPVPLTRSFKDGKLLISLADLRNGAAYFRP